MCAPSYSAAACVMMLAEVIPKRALLVAVADLIVLLDHRLRCHCVSLQERHERLARARTAIDFHSRCVLNELWIVNHAAESGGENRRAIGRNGWRSHERQGRPKGQFREFDEGALIVVARDLKSGRH